MKRAKKAITRRGSSYTIDLMESRRQIDAGTMPASDRRLIERILGEALPIVDARGAPIPRRTSQDQPEQTREADAAKEGSC